MSNDTIVTGLTQVKPVIKILVFTLSFNENLTFSKLLYVIPQFGF